MLLTDKSIQDYIGRRYKGFNFYSFKDVPVADEKEFVVIKDFLNVNEGAIDFDKDVYVRNLTDKRQTNCLNIQILCESLNAYGNDLEEEIYKELEQYNGTYTKAYIRNAKNWIDLKAFFIACEKAKKLIGNKNPRIFSDISKFFFILNKKILSSANIKLNLINLRSQIELMHIEARKSNFDMLIQPVTTIVSKNQNVEECETLIMTKYIDNVLLHKEMKFDHIHFLFGAISGLSARNNSQKEFGKIKAHCYQYRLVDLLKYDFGYLNYEIKVGEGLEQPIFVNDNLIARRVFLQKEQVNCEFSGFSKFIVGEEALPKHKFIYNFNKPTHLSNFSEEELAALVYSGEGIIVHQIVNSLYDNASNIVVEEGEIYGANYNLFSIYYTQKQLKLSSIPDYVRNLFPSSRAKQLQHAINIRMFDLIQTSEKKAQYWREQADRAKEELQIVKKIIVERANEIERTSEQKTDTFIKLAHDTKTPLLMVAHNLNEYIKKNGETEELMIVRENLEKIKKDIVNFYDLEKLQKGLILYQHNQTINLSQIIHDSIILFQHYASSKGIKIVEKIKEGMFIKADPEAICRIANNLIENAIKFTEKGGEITIGLTTTRHKILFAVKDTGIGIPRELHEKIFLPYYQSSERKTNEGIGLGLAIVKRITENLDGEIKLNSNSKGTEISIEFSKYELMENEQVLKFSIGETPTMILDELQVTDELKEDNRPTILIIMEKASLMNTLVKKLKEKFNIAIALSGQEGLNRIKSMKHLDLILADISMRNDRGIEFYAKLSTDKQYNHIPLFILTSQATVEEKLRGLNYGAVDCIEKPFSIEELIYKMEAFLKTLENQRIKLINSAYQQISQSNVVVEPYEIDITTFSTSQTFEENCKHYNLTKQEIEVFRLFVQGKSYKEIGESLFKSTGTVGTQINSAYRKIGVNNVAKAISKLVSPA